MSPPKDTTFVYEKHNKHMVTFLAVLSRSVEGDHFTNEQFLSMSLLQGRPQDSGHGFTSHPKWDGTGWSGSSLSALAPLNVLLELSTVHRVISCHRLLQPRRCTCCEQLFLHNRIQKGTVWQRNCSTALQMGAVHQNIYPVFSNLPSSVFLWLLPCTRSIADQLSQLNSNDMASSDNKGDLSHQAGLNQMLWKSKVLTITLVIYLR